MKRSDAITVIRDTYNYSADIIDCMTEYQAELILNQLEKMGMAPPIITIGYEDELLGKINMAKRQWEEEF